MPKKKKVTRTKKPIGFIKQGKSFKLVFGTKTKPKLSKRSFRTKKSMLDFLRKK